MQQTDAKQDKAAACGGRVVVAGVVIGDSDSTRIKNNASHWQVMVNDNDHHDDAVEDEEAGGVMMLQAEY